MRAALTSASIALTVALLPWAGAAAQSDDPRETELPPELADSSGGSSMQGGQTLPDQPPHIIGGIGAGGSLRLTEQEDFAQERLAPAYIDAWGSYIFEGAGVWRHGVGLGLSLNVMDDGSETFGVGAGEQLVVAPSYTAYFPVLGAPVPDLLVFAKGSIPLALTPDFSPGLEVAGGAAYMFLAGLGAYLEVGVSAFLGGQEIGFSRNVTPGDNVINPLVSAEVGVMIDYEVLP